jgi:YidC/Oxa1 family membrane protein insertase
MDKRTLLAIALSILVLVAFSFLTPQRQVQKQPPPAPQTEKEVEKKVMKEVEPEPPVTETPDAPAVMPVDEREVYVETDLYSAVFTTKGATIKKWDLKDYPDNEQNPVSLVRNENVPLPPLSIVTAEKPADQLVRANYTADKDSVTLVSTGNSETLTFFYSEPSGLAVKKTFTFYRGDYRVDLTTEVRGTGPYRVVIGSGFGLFDEEGAWVHIGPVLLRDTDKIDIDRNNIEGIGFIGRMTGKVGRNEIRYPGNVRWIAQEDKYFTAAMAASKTNYDAVVWSWQKDGNNPTKGAEIAYEVKSEKGEFLLYAGPKRDEILKTYGLGLEHIIDFGFFSPIARPIFWLLKLFYRIIGNYGWAIVLITIVIRIPFIPIINKGQKSMKKLQVVQPQMAALKEKYKNDPQKMQKETMELYKKHKVNPVGGCLPMLLQVPVFFALYKILLIAIEIRNAPFILWIHDLSAKDPYYVFPVLMGLSMVIQQKMTPSGMDPKQAKIMMLMPVIFTFMFLTFPAGLVLYWLVSNTLGIIQQYFVNKKTESPAK